MKGTTEQFAARIDSRLFANIERLAKNGGKSRNEVLNILLREGLISLSKKKAARSAHPTADSHISDLSTT